MPDEIDAVMYIQVGDYFKAHLIAVKLAQSVAIKRFSLEAAKEHMVS